MRKLLCGSWALFTSSFGFLLVSAVLLAIAYTFFVSSISRSMDRDLGKMTQSFGLPEERYQEYIQRIEEGDDTATLEMMQEVNALAEQLESMTEEEREEYMAQKARHMASELSSYFMLFGLVSLLLMICGTLVSLVVYTEEHSHIIDVIRRCGALFFPMVAVWMWVFVRSFGWVFIFGLLPSLEVLNPFLVLISVVAVLILGPLLILSPVLLVQESLSAREAVCLSLRSSKGHWGRIVGSTIVVGILITLLHALMGTGIAVIAQYSRGGAIFIAGVVQQLTIFFFAAFLIVLLKSLTEQKRE